MRWYDYFLFFGVIGLAIVFCMNMVRSREAKKPHLVKLKPGQWYKTGAYVEVWVREEDVYKPGGGAVMRILIVVVILSLAGCDVYGPYRDQAQIAKDKAIKKQPDLTDDQKIDLLRKEAHKRGLQWKDFCVDTYIDDDGDHNIGKFLAVAWKEGIQESQFVDRWMEGGSTQADAAYALYFSIQQTPTHPAEAVEKPELPKHRHNNKICPPEIRGN